MTGLIFVVQLPFGLAPLLYTQKSKSVCSLFTRYIDTVHHVRRWYEEDLFDDTSAGSKSLRQVREMHKHIAVCLNSRNGNNNIPMGQASNRIWVSQYDMVVTQWAFIGLIVMYPEKCGLHNSTEKEISAIIYAWRVIGYLIGIEDEFNLCSGNLKDTRQMCDIIFNEVYRPVLAAKYPPEPQGKEMALDIVKSMEPVLGKISGEVFHKYWFEFLGIKEVPLNNLRDWFSYFLMVLYNDYVFCIRPIYTFFGWLMYKSMTKAINNKDKLADKMSLESRVHKYRFEDMKMF